MRCVFLRSLKRGGVCVVVEHQQILRRQQHYGGAQGHTQYQPIMRFVCANNPKADKIRLKIRGYAADRWKTTGDTVARSIACFLWRGPANVMSYKSGLAVVARAKFANNPKICNALCLTHGISLQTSFDASHMVTVTRKKTSHEYMQTLSDFAS